MIHDYASFVKNITDKFSQLQNNRPQVCTLRMYNRKLTENKRICYDKFRMEKQLTGRNLLLFPLKI